MKTTIVPGPSLGRTVEQVWRAWQADPGDFTGRGWRDTFAYDIDQSLEFFHGVDGEVWVALAASCATPLCRLATKDEIERLLQAIGRGRVSIYRRGRCDAYADRRNDRLELHRVTKQAMPVDDLDAA